MRTENLFRFVAIRGPLPGTDAPTTVAGPRDSVFMARIIAGIDTGVPLGDARRDAAASFLDSSDYVMRNASWKPFLAIELLVQRLLAEISPNEDLGSAIEQLLAGPIGSMMSLETFVAGPQFAALKESLWHSYYSNVILLTRRPHDLPRLLFWIRCWRRLERLADGEQPPGVTADFDSWQPALPHLLVRADARADAGAAATVTLSAAPLAERRSRIAAANAALAEVRAAHAQVRQLTETKLTATRSRAVAATPAERRADGVLLQLGEDDHGSMMLAADELDPAVKATLGRLGLSPARDDALELTAALEHRLAVARSEVARLRRVDQVVSVGGALVRRRRRLTDAELNGEAPA